MRTEPVPRLVSLYLSSRVPCIPPVRHDISIIALDSIKRQYKIQPTLFTDQEEREERIAEVGTMSTAVI